MKIKIIYAFFLIFWTYSIKAQIPKEKSSIPSPQAWNFTQYGNIPISYFTGLPDISIPLANIESADFKMPISLRYNVGAIRPDVHPGTTGLGWSLSLGGVVSRTIRGIPDELSFKRNIPTPQGTIDDTYLNGWMWNNDVWDFSENFSIDNILKILPDFKCNPNYELSHCPSYAYIGPHWIPYYGNGTNQYPYDYQCYRMTSGQNAPTPSRGQLDVLKDEFNFNVNGLSGSFYLTKGNWVSISDIKCNRKVKIELLGSLIDVAPELRPIWPYPSNGTAYYGHWDIIQNTNPWFQSNAFPKTISGFRIIDEDGTVYNFGKTHNGSNGYNAIEYSMGLFNYQEPWSAIAWHLSSILTPDLKGFYFSYDRGPKNYINIGSFQTSLYRSSFYSVFGNETAQTSNFVGGRIIYPSYLISVKSDIANIDLTYSKSTQLTYDPTDYIYSPSTGALFNSVYHTCINVYNSTFDWQKLDNVSISIKSRPKVNYSFTYNNISTERLFLKKLSMQVNDLSSTEHSFEYDNSINMPQYLAEQNDHWGFWNGTNTNVTELYFAISKQPNAAYLYPGVLTKINYPTGGYTQFTYEPNEYAKYVKHNRTEGVINAGGNIMAGGLRIKQIKSYDPIAQINFNQKQYFYKTGYNNSLTESQINALSSSGVLNSQIQYSWRDQVSYWSNTTAWTPGQFSVFSNQSIQHVYDKYHIGYSEVVEKLSDGSFSIFKFSNHDNGYTDDNFTNSLSAYVSSPYTKYSNNDFKRGLLLEKSDYNNNNVLLAKKTITYKANDASLPYFYDWDINYFHSSVSQEKYTKTALFGTVYKVFKYAFVPDIEKNIIYDQNGGNPLTMQTQNFYENPLHGYITKSVTLDSKGNEITNIYKRAGDYLPDFMLRNIANSRPGTILEKLQLKKDPITNIQSIVGGELNEYALSVGNNMPWLNSIYKLEIEKPISLSDFFETKPMTRNMNSILYQKDSRYKEALKILKYDNNYNSLDLLKKNGERNIILRGNKNNDIIANINITADNYQDWNFLGYTSFELYKYDSVDSYGYDFQMSQMDAEKDFIYTPQLISTTEAFSGQRSFNGQVESIGYVHEAAIYVLAKRGGNVPILQIRNAANVISNGPAFIKIGERAGWDIYKVIHSSGGTKIIINSNGNLIDELRILARNTKAIMTTYTYQNGLISTITDPNFNSLNYEYDRLGRLIYIRDKDKNIIKSYDYNFHHQP